MILLGSEIRFWGGRGPGDLVRLAGDAGFDGLALGPWCTRGDAVALVAEAAKSGMVVPVGASFQDLMVVTKRKDGSLDQKAIIPVRVARMEGQAQGGR